MKTKVSFIIIACTMLVPGACSKRDIGNNNGSGSDTTNPTTGSPVETNPQGLAIHPVTGDIWESEHGPRGGDEINRLQPGANYGWPVISYGIEYSGQPVGAGIQQQSGMEQPVYYWDPVVSPSGITFYAGNRVAEWQNNLFLCSLTQTHLIRFVIQNNRVTGEERLFASENQRFGISFRAQIMRYMPLLMLEDYTGLTGNNNHHDIALTFICIFACLKQWILSLISPKSSCRYRCKQ